MKKKASKKKAATKRFSPSPPALSVQSQPEPNLGKIAGRDPKTGRFLPGYAPRKGMPGVGGRPKEDFKRRMREHSPAGEKAIVEALAAKDEAGNPLHKHRIAAAKEVFDRAWGKADQKLDVEGGPIAIIFSLGALPDPEEAEEDDDTD